MTLSANWSGAVTGHALLDHAFQWACPSARGPFRLRNQKPDKDTSLRFVLCNETRAAELTKCLLVCSMFTLQQAPEVPTKAQWLGGIIQDRLSWKL
ncbi:hypothetical protein LB507_009455 [Fusarium sp. FIESC RH6]|nr:hypothetical protein LB507_009455 [Fusarium sp. FIESC RH6]